MIRMIQSQSSGHAKAYFSDALAKSDYYLGEQELAGIWQGKLCERLGIVGVTDKNAFFALCENRDPRSGEALTPRTKEERTTGYDINFHCPKSVSLLHVFSKDDHILKAFQQSVTETMGSIEADGKTRIRLGGVCDDRSTSELAWAQFVHQTARPVDGSLPDPHLHSHCFVFNATWDDSEQRIKAGQFREIKRDMPYYQAQFHKILSDKLSELGYGIRRTDKSFEIEGVPQRAIDLFSKRTDEIGRVAKEKGITDAKELGELGARTRARKQKGESMTDLKKEWHAQIEVLGKHDEDQRVVRFAPEIEKPALNVVQCLDHAILHCFERASVMADRRVLETAYRHAIGTKDISVDEISKAYEEDSRFIHVLEGSRRMCTTREVLAQEKHMVELARQGQGKIIPMYSEPPKMALIGQQADAVAHVLTTNHRVSIIRGAAGTGKTTLMKEAASHFKAAGKEVIVVAPTAQASRGVLKEDGFKDADTVAKLLTDTKMQERIKGQVLWVDEAGLLGTKDMTALLDLASKNHAQLILGGDTRQHASVVRGDAMRILNIVAGIPVAEVSKIYRQKNDNYRSAVEDLSNGNVMDGFDKLNVMGFIKTIDPMNVNSKLVEDYLEVLKKGKSALVISPTHAQGEKITEEIRNGLREQGLIGKKESTVTRFKNLNLTEAEKSDHRCFQSGQLVQFNQNVKGFGRGTIWKVEEGKNQIFLVNDKGEVKLLPQNVSERYDVFSKDTLQLSKGDKVLITRNSFDSENKRLDNGTMLKVVSVSKNGEMTFRNSKSGVSYKFDKNFGHFTHAYCITSHASQGKTVDEVFIHQPASTFSATDSKQFYVSVSRGKDFAHIYTDDKNELLRHVAELDERTSAIELIENGKKSHKDFVIQKLREEKEILKSEKQKDYEFDR